MESKIYESLTRNHTFFNKSFRVGDHPFFYNFFNYFHGGLKLGIML